MTSMYRLCHRIDNLYKYNKIHLRWKMQWLFYLHHSHHTLIQHLYPIYLILKLVVCADFPAHCFLKGFFQACRNQPGHSALMTLVNLCLLRKYIDRFLVKREYQYYCMKKS
eukprot:NODE_267_length_11298_cov_1.167872.p10 type:complete len:111 gc:universal NODE_267_length_11298_cov_1.167872:7638-7306(-)